MTQALSRSDLDEPGFSRRRSGRGFRYLSPAGQRVTDAETLRRIKSLVIPPAWTDVWICPDPAGHIQAVGTDAAARRQYRYHDAWREERDQRKYDHILESTIDRVLRDLGASTEFGQLATHGQAEAAVLRLLARASAKDP